MWKSGSGGTTWRWNTSSIDTSAKSLFMLTARLSSSNFKLLAMGRLRFGGQRYVRTPCGVGGGMRLGNSPKHCAGEMGGFRSSNALWDYCLSQTAKSINHRFSSRPIFAFSALQKNKDFFSPLVKK